ncbi:sulfurtransferase complex subunit TusC [Pseudomonas sp. DTU_2021_1001937_2_SI_NGA_ILE_001]|uniref:sulfurtransferase complex subunit TusC n=1 Tax=Pseudomonas sp. DTU_2021_1001937_2_SI_NGA_ILE_001 TaxID=3077589 RepID=UPI0028FC0AEC|nr:sulfurtransferase complex subunit TusC [Pseudomonas sp. DTU_2021_1001937_2_SI_NGA_ILE_001]WNW09704.1 sulfurtransferase complex subunit TusC [Pseudomonas sp. DTU_2021_1001937_2_SI_NGA_ILE_001]
MSKSLLIISRQAPWSGPGAREALDIVLAAGAFDLPVALLFLDDGVFQLQAGQTAGAVQQKDVTANLKALPMFGVEELYACGHSLQQRGICTATLDEAIEPLASGADIAALIARYDQVITI